MIEHHYVVIYNATTGSWYIDDSAVALPNGIIYDTSTGHFRHIEEHELAEDWMAHEMLANALFEFTKKTDKLVGQ
jgi:hypothetical protein